jgi:DNA-binding MarR family transcriptional regulator
MIPTTEPSLQRKDLDTRPALEALLNTIGLFQKLSPTITLESIKTFLVVALNENKSVQDYARLAGAAAGPVSRRIGEMTELSFALRPGLNLLESRPDPADRRLILVRLTHQGRAFARRVAKTYDGETR